MRHPLPASLLCVLLCAPAARADDGRGLSRGGDPAQVSISGVSSGAAMAVQYAVAHSASVTAVGSIAGPSWGCAEGSLARAVETCLCGGEPQGAQVEAARIEAARPLAEAKLIDPLTAGRPQRLARAYVFHSPADRTVRSPAGRVSARFLENLTGRAVAFDDGDPADGSDAAGHGIITPGPGRDACRLEERGDDATATFVRSCGREDNVGHMFHALFGEEAAYDPERRAPDIPEADLWRFDQGRLVAQVTAERPAIANDAALVPFWPATAYSTARRRNLDMAATGYLYVPPACRPAGRGCRVHIALHGCRQDPRHFALAAGYNNWAEPYRVIIVYPAIAPGTPLAGSACGSPIPDFLAYEPNPNGCWDWWGYLDSSYRTGRYLTRDAPQIRVIAGIVAAVTAPAPP
ncbi:depolymerase [Methylobacterium sp. sgz302003]|uniref:depolymerase n=3 Tax=Methylobacterium oryzisoli TaxID=3385502 RepID=UPI00397A5A94